MRTSIVISCPLTPKYLQNQLNSLDGRRIAPRHGPQFPDPSSPTLPGLLRKGGSRRSAHPTDQTSMV